MIFALLLFPVFGMDTLRVVSDFGEYRPLFRFHMGWDLSTGGAIGWPLVLSDTFQVIRIRDGHWGYGRAVYGLDSRGRRWVFAHLDRLHPRLERRLVQVQREQKRVTVDLNLTPPVVLLPGETLALSGWTGNVDPHIHVEFRDSAWRPVHPGRVLPYPWGSRARFRIQGLRVVPLSSETRVEGAPFTREYRTLPETLHVEGPFGLWAKAQVQMDGYLTTPWEIILQSSRDTLVHVRLDTLDYAHQHEMPFLYVYGGRFFSDLWIRLYGFPPPPHQAYRRSIEALQPSVPTPFTLTFRHPLAETSFTVWVVPGSPQRPKGLIVWDTLGSFRVQAHPWGLALLPEGSEKVLWIREPGELPIAGETLHVIRLEPGTSQRIVLGSVTVDIPGNLLSPWFAVHNGRVLRPRWFPLQSPLEIRTSPPWVVGLWGRGRFVRLGRLYRLPDWTVRRDTLPPRILSCERLPDRIRIHLEDDVAGWDPDSTAVWVGENWTPFLSNAARGVLDVLDVRNPAEIMVDAGDGVGHRGRLRCPSAEGR